MPVASHNPNEQLNPKFVVPSEYALGGFQYIEPPDSHHDPTPEERREAEKALEMDQDEVVMRCGSEHTYRWMLEKNLLGTATRTRSHRGIMTRLLRPLAPEPDRLVFRRDVVEAGFQELRAMAGSLVR